MTNRFKALAIKALATLAFATSLWGQQSPAVYQTLATDWTLNSHTSTVRNIGQTNHTFFLVFKAQPTKTCSTIRTSNTSDPQVGIYASWEPAGQRAYVPTHTVSVTQGAAGSAFRKVITGSILAPYIGLFFTGFDFTNCAVDIYYSGGIYSPALDSNTNFTGYFPSTTTVTFGGPLSGTPASLGGVNTTDAKIVMLGLTVQLTTAAQVQIQEILPDNSPGQIVYVVYAPANTPVIIPISSIPYAQSRASGRLGISVSTGTPTGVGSFTYRWE